VATRDFWEDMDPVGRFIAGCVTPEPAGRVQARALYEAYKSWAMANALNVFSEARFGRPMKQRFPRDDRSHTRAHLGIALHDVPARPDLLAEGNGAVRRREVFVEGFEGLSRVAKSQKMTMRQ
jgi:putative DNA primase/helicase